MVVAQSSQVEIGRYWFIDYAFEEYAAIMVDGGISRYRTFADLGCALDAVLGWQCAQ